VLGQGIEAWRATGSETYRAYSLALLADAHRRCGRADDALAALAEADRATAETGERLCEPEVHRLRGELLAGRSAGAAETAFRSAVVAARGQQAHALHLRAAVGLGRFLRDRGRVAEARAVVAEAVGPADGLRDAPEMLEAKALLRE
jgi:adenylate cyclase